ncbi:unnamed protein product [Prorocentrum cordatum]|uniref:Uncharacterized protein n=1 Tax=Prorocentrum cordatum TaxID=2364126 RepID=A0ABN9PX79_9DINO|nr:unnamed protein product [Polarella glacialis]
MRGLALISSIGKSRGEDTMSSMALKMSVGTERAEEAEMPALPAVDVADRLNKQASRVIAQVGSSSAAVRRIKKQWSIFETQVSSIFSEVWELPVKYAGDEWGIKIDGISFGRCACNEHIKTEAIVGRQLIWDCTKQDKYITKDLNPNIKVLDLMIINRSMEHVNACSNLFYCFEALTDDDEGHYLPNEMNYQYGNKVVNNLLLDLHWLEQSGYIGRDHNTTA